VLAGVPWLGRLVAAMNARAMTIYLWGNLAIFAATPVIESNRWTRPLSVPTWQGRATQYAVAWLVIVVIVLAVGWVEDVAAGRAPRINPWPRRVDPARVEAATARWRGRRSSVTLCVLAATLTGVLLVGVLGPVGSPRLADDAEDGALPGTTATRTYPLHRAVPASVFRIGAVVPREGVDGQSLQSGWDRDWARHYGGCDGFGPVGLWCASDLTDRTGPDWFPVGMVPKENPYYVGLPYNDLLDISGRGAIPWARDPGYAEHLGDERFSLVKNRWVQVTGPAGTCSGQVEDTGLGTDPGYVLGAAAPQRTPAINLSPALAGCVGITDASAVTAVDWAFVDRPAPGPWTVVVTRRQANVTGDPNGRRP
jgi:hypothetical protein